MTESKQITERFGWLDRDTVWTVLICKLVVLVFAAQSYQVVADKPLAAPHGFLGIWQRWDAVNYLDIAQLGYLSSGSHLSPLKNND